MRRFCCNFRDFYRPCPLSDCEARDETASAMPTRYGWSSGSGLRWDHPGEDVRLKGHDDAHDGGQGDTVPEHEPENAPFLSDLPGRRCRDDDALRVDHF